MAHSLQTTQNEKDQLANEKEVVDQTIIQLNSQIQIQEQQIVDKSGIVERLKSEASQE